MSLLRLIYLWRVGCDGEVEKHITMQKTEETDNKNCQSVFTNRKITYDLLINIYMYLF